jgi:hypothetical protein
VGIFITAALLRYAGFLGLLYFSQDSMIYPGTKNLVGSAPPATAGMEIIRLPTVAGNVEALFLPATDAPAAAMDAPYDHMAADPRVDRTRILGWDPEHLPFWQGMLDSAPQ